MALLPSVKQKAQSRYATSHSNLQHGAAIVSCCQKHTCCAKFSSWLLHQACSEPGLTILTVFSSFAVCKSQHVCLLQCQAVPNIFRQFTAEALPDVLSVQLNGNCSQGHLFRAMRKAKLIGEHATWQQLNYSRCGRTDKGVSAAGQVRTASWCFCYMLSNKESGFWRCCPVIR